MSNSHTQLVSDAMRRALALNNPSMARARANEMIPIAMGTSTTATATKEIAVTGLLATDIVIAIATSSAGYITYVVPATDKFTAHASAATVPFSWVAFRPTSPV